MSGLWRRLRARLTAWRLLMAALVLGGLAALVGSLGSYLAGSLPVVALADVMIMLVWAIAGMFWWSAAAWWKLTAETWRTEAAAWRDAAELWRSAARLWSSPAGEPPSTSDHQP